MSESFTSSARELEPVDIYEASDVSPADNWAVKDLIITLKF
jgi:hypothetical protein